MEYKKQKKEEKGNKPSPSSLPTFYLWNAQDYVGVWLHADGHAKRSILHTILAALAVLSTAALLSFMNSATALVASQVC
jgi:hypothetical protein